MMQHSDVVVKLKNCVELNPEETVRALAIARQLANSWEDAEFAYENGLLSERTFGLSLRDIMLVRTELPGLVPFLGYLVDNYYHMERFPSRVATQVVKLSDANPCQAE